MGDVLTDLPIFNLVSLFLQSILYGIYLITCGGCAAALSRVNGRWRSRKELQWPFLLAGLFLLLNMTRYLCIQFYSCLEPLIHRGSDGPSTPGAFSSSNIIKVRYISQWQYQLTLRKCLISLPKFSANRLWGTSFSFTGLSSCIGGIGRLLHHLSSYGLPI